MQEDFRCFPLGQAFNWGDMFLAQSSILMTVFQESKKETKKKKEFCYLFVYFPHIFTTCFFSLLNLGYWTMNRPSFLAQSVISARPQFGPRPRPTGDPCSCKTAGSGPCLNETVHQRGCLASLHLSA